MKVKRAGRIKVESKELIRKESGGGGLATMVKTDLSPVWISEGDDTTEVLVVEINIEGKNICVINAYGPHAAVTEKTNSGAGFNMR